MKKNKGKSYVKDDKCRFCFACGCLSFHNLDCGHIRVLKRDLVRCGLNAGLSLDVVNDVIHHEIVSFVVGLSDVSSFVQSCLDEFKTLNLQLDIKNF